MNGIIKRASATRYGAYGVGAGSLLGAGVGAAKEHFSDKEEKNYLGAAGRGAAYGGAAGGVLGAGYGMMQGGSGGGTPPMDDSPQEEEPHIFSTMVHSKKEEDLVNEIQEKGELDDDLASRLDDAALDSWYGPKSEFEEKVGDLYESQKPGDQHHTQHISIKLDEPNSDLGPDAGSLDRADALMGLGGAQVHNVSPPQPQEAYLDRGYYPHV